MIRPGIEPRSPWLLVNTLLIRPINKEKNSRCQWQEKKKAIHNIHFLFYQHLIMLYLYLTCLWVIYQVKWMLQPCSFPLHCDTISSSTTRCTYVGASISVCVCVCVCVYIYIYIYIYVCGWMYNRLQELTKQLREVSKFYKDKKKKKKKKKKDFSKEMKTWFF